MTSVGHEHCVLELGGALLVAREDGPAVPGDVELRTALREHGLDGEHVALLEPELVLVAAVRHEGRRVEGGADAVPAVLADDTVAAHIGRVGARVADFREARAGSDDGDRGVEGPARGVDEPAARGVDVADAHGAAVVAKNAVDENAHVERDDVAVPEDARVRNPVANDVVWRRADRLGKAHVVVRRGIRACEAPTAQSRRRRRAQSRRWEAPAATMRSCTSASMASVVTPGAASAHA